VVTVQKRFIQILLTFVSVMLSVSIQAKSFSADAVQIRDGQFSHARMFWSDGNVRFEYLDNGVPMVQIYDLKNKKITWLDTENKLYVQNDLGSEQMIDPMLKESKTSSNPCKLLKQAECTRLKEVDVNGRKAVKWLVTTQLNGRDQHAFQWLDKEYNVVVRQENSDNSTFEVSIDDDQEMNGRKVRKLGISINSNGTRSKGAQWYDAELNIIVRQHYQNGAEDELRNIKIEKIGKNMFAIPDGYKLFDAETLASEPNFSDIKGVAGPVNN
jgi:hypothetical protein